MVSGAAAARRPIGFAVFTIVLGAIGWFASFELLTEYIRTLQNPGYSPACDVSLLVTCGPNMDAPQGSVLGFSNTIIGVAAFVAPIAVGVALAAGATFGRWFWWCYQAGLALGFVFICWLAYQSIFALGTLCPWCMVVWVVMIPLWWATFFRPHTVGDVPVGERARNIFQSLYSWTWVIVLLCYLVIAAVAQFRLDWFAEFARL